MQRTVLSGGQVITPWVVLERGVVIFSGGKIEYVGQEYLPKPNDQLIDVTGKIITPGLIDLHIHGGGGHDVMYGTEEDVLAIAKNLLKSGVTSFVPSLYAAEMKQMFTTLDNINRAYKIQQEKGSTESQIVGIYLEAPFMNPIARGGHPIDAVISPVRKNYLELINRAGELLKLVLVAPEVKGGMELIEYVLSRGLIAAIGHSEASYDQVVDAVKLGLDHVIHVFNGNDSGISKREPGLVGAALNLDELFCELICDGIHVHPANMKMVYKLKGTDKIVLISDATKPAGMPDGDYPLADGRIMHVKNGVTSVDGTLPGTLSGSTLGLNRGVCNMVELVGATLQEAVKMATVNPAKRLNLTNKGSLLAGKDADIVVFSKGLEPEQIYLGGALVTY